MRFLSIKNLMTQLKEVLVRFPYAMGMAIAGTAVAISLVEDVEIIRESFLPNMLITLVLGFFLFVAIELYLERNKKYQNVIPGLAALFLIGYFLLLPDQYSGDEFQYALRSFLFGFAFLMSVTFAPFVHKEEINGFWQHNKNLFVRLFFTGVYTGVLFLGLVLALYSSEQLLGLSIRDELYGELWIFIVGVIATSFFLAGIPKSLASLNKAKDYPKGIKVFSQYIMVPLLTLYFVILYSYAAKILFTGQWPEGIVSWLILLFSFAGIFTYFLVYPAKDSKEHAWVAKFSKAIFALIIPMTFMLFWAIKLRIDDYAITEKRYYVVVLGLWLLGLSIYFLWSKKKNLKVVTLSLFVIALVSSFGPWGALSVSENSQFQRLSDILARNNLISEEGTLVKLEGEIPVDDVIQISSILSYLDNYHGFARLQPWVEGREDLSEDCRKDAHCIVEVGLGTEYRYFYRGGSNDYTYFYGHYHDRPLDIAGYSTLLFNVDYYQGGGYSKASVEGTVVTFTDEELGIIEIDLADFIAQLEPADRDRDPEEMTVETDEARFILTDLRIKHHKKDIQEIDSLGGVLMLK